MGCLKLPYCQNTDRPNFLGLWKKNSVLKKSTDYQVWGDVLREMKAAEFTYRFGYQGQFAEKDEETGWNHFELREYDAIMGRTTTPDLARQFYSSYLWVGNDPINNIDPTGGICPTCPKGGQYDQYINANGDFTFDAESGIVVNGIGLDNIVIRPDLIYGSFTPIQTSGYYGSPKDFQAAQNQAAYEAANVIFWTGVAFDFAFDTNLSGANPTPEGQARMPMPIFMGGSSRMASVADKASDISKALNVNSLTIRGAGNATNKAGAIKHIRFDLRGAAHGNIPTPHKTVYTIHKNPLTGKGSTKAETLPMTNTDIRMITNYLKSIK
jgi:RHS repeat-associated protein